MSLLMSFNNFTTSNGTGSPTKAVTTDGFRGEARILVAAIVEVVLCLLGSTGNFLTCFAVFRNRNLQFATNFFIVSLAVADLLVCTILVPMRSAQHFALFLGKPGISSLAAKVMGFVGRVNIVASICNLAALSIDRCIALNYPMRYRFFIRFATWRVLGVIVAFWIFAVGFTSLPYIPGFTDDVFLIGFIVFVFLITFIIMVAYCRIFHIASQARRRRRKGKVGALEIIVQEKREQNANLGFSDDSLAFHHSRKRRRSDVPPILDSENRSMSRKEQHQDRKTTKTIGMVIGAFIVLVYPRIIMILYHYGNAPSSASKLAKFWVRILLYSNSVINPMLYAWRMREFRNEFRKILFSVLKFGRSSDLSTTHRSTTTTTNNMSTDHATVHN